MKKTRIKKITVIALLAALMVNVNVIAYVAAAGIESKTASETVTAAPETVEAAPETVKAASETVEAAPETAAIPVSPTTATEVTRIAAVTSVIAAAGTAAAYTNVSGKTDISKAKITLSQRQVRTTGKVCAPKVKSVVLTKNGKNVTIPKSAYTVTYQNENGKTIKYVKRAGTYTLFVTAKSGSAYSGTCETIFTVIGTPQELIIEETEITLYLKAQSGTNEKNSTDEDGKENAVPDYTLNPGATGDGTGFTFTSNNKKVVKVDKEGNLFCVGKGTTTVMIKTKGDLISQPASVRITVNVE